MSTDTPTHNNALTVQDDENVVDKKIKTHILELRQQIDQDERDLYVNKLSAGQISREQANFSWSTSVRQYLRAIKRLWHDDDDIPTETNRVKNVEFYWNEKVIDEHILYPPDTDGYQFSLIQEGQQYNDIELKQAIGIPPQQPLPKPKQITFAGLSDILAKDMMEATWMVTVGANNGPASKEIVTPSVQRAIPYQTLERTVEVADNFLQQAGLGLGVGDDMSEWGFKEVDNVSDDVEVI